MTRDYTDAHGIRWKVYMARPSEDRESLPEPMRDGWLCFYSPGASRRLAPPPLDWEHCDPNVLADYFANAEPYSRPPGQGW